MDEDHRLKIDRHMFGDDVPGEAYEASRMQAEWAMKESEGFFLVSVKDGEVEMCFHAEKITGPALCVAIYQSVLTLMTEGP